MIKLKLHNPSKGRNQAAFRIIHIIQQLGLWESYGFEFVSDNSYDFLLVGSEDFINRKLPLSQAISSGLSNLNQLSGDYILIDPTDSTSILGTYEVFVQSNAKLLLRNQYLPQSEYNKYYNFGKWWWGSDISLPVTKAYDIPDSIWQRMKLTGWNLGHWHPDFLIKERKLPVSKDIDILSLIATHKENVDFDVRNDIYYNDTRSRFVQQLRSKILNVPFIKTYFGNKIPFSEYIPMLERSKLVTSPFGMGEINFRDFEAIINGAMVIKENLDNVITLPNFFKNKFTYIALSSNNVLESINEGLYQQKYYIDYIYKAYFQNYQYEHICIHWKSLFEGISQ